jgi:hypothetical protein
MADPLAGQLAILLRDFCFSTICGHESAFYKMFVKRQEDLNNLKEGGMSNFIKFATANYLNGAYVSLIKKNDPYIIEKFGEMCQINNHSAICLLNIIAVVILKVHTSLDRKLFNINSYELYMGSISQQLNIESRRILEKLTKNVSHQCHGTDISTCDPNKPMFGVSATII